MIRIDQYFGWKINHAECTEEMKENATGLLDKVNAFLDWAAAQERRRYKWDIDPDTGTNISGAKGGDGDGGFRLSTSKTGAAHSVHKTAHGVDVYDPSNDLDDIITDEVLAKFGLYREHPHATPGWCHLQDVPPKSGKRTYLP